MTDPVTTASDAIILLLFFFGSLGFMFAFWEIASWVKRLWKL